MLKIGTNEYEGVDWQSTLSVSLFPPGEGVIGRQQLWELETNFCPFGGDYRPLIADTDEILKLWIRAENHHVADWNQLTGLGVADETKPGFTLASLSNLLNEDRHEREFDISVDELTLEQNEGFIFSVEIDGTHTRPDGTEEELHVLEIVTFKKVVAYVPLNAADPVATAKAMAKQQINLTEFASHRIIPYDPQRASSLISHINSHHKVILETAWR
jgi:hypothetical protein